MWRVEAAGTGDAAGLAALYRRVWDGYRGALPDALLDHRSPDAREIASLMADMTYFVVRDGDGIIGVARCHVECEACYLERMVVDAPFRRMGVGTALVERVVRHANENSCHKVFLNTSPKLTDSMAFYERMGFARCGLFHRHFWGEDVIFYELLL
ncbi:MAG: GNAT family N-acetyltransferase [Thermoplasmata archaeon]|nr:GNAT family N-acetyltransferase [Thermoplasmata archaeon]